MYKILTDSSSNLTEEMIEKLGVEVISFNTVVGGEEIPSYIKGKKTNLQAFYNKLREKNSVTTVAINQQGFYEYFEEHIKKGQDIIYLGFSSGMSSTFEQAIRAGEELQKKYKERKIYVIDTKGASMGEGLIVYYAATMKNEGKSIEEVKNWIEENKLKIQHWFTVDDLYWLFKGGRVTKTAYWVANIAKIKPILNIDRDGKIVPIKKVIGRKHALMFLVERVVEEIKNPREQVLFISHGDCIEEATMVAERIKEKIKVKDVVFNYIDPVIGCHSGPGTVAVFYLGEER